MRKSVDNCYQCNHYQICILRKSIEDVLDMGHHNLTSGGHKVLRDSIPLRFFELLAAKCKIKEATNE